MPPVNPHRIDDPPLPESEQAAFLSAVVERAVGSSARRECTGHDPREGVEAYVFLCGE
jgi:hypothetical protein